MVEGLGLGYYFVLGRGVVGLDKKMDTTRSKPVFLVEAGEKVRYWGIGIIKWLL